MSDTYMKGPTLYQRLIAAGYPESDMFNHESDLYVFKTDITEQVIDEWLSQNGLDKALFVKTFKDNITGKPMFDIAFAYDPYWNQKAR